MADATLGDDELCMAMFGTALHTFFQSRELFPDATILRFSFFLENYLPAPKTVKEEGKLYGPAHGDAMSPYMAACDGGKAAAGSRKQFNFVQKLFLLC